MVFSGMVFSGIAKLVWLVLQKKLKNTMAKTGPKPGNSDQTKGRTHDGWYEVCNTFCKLTTKIDKKPFFQSSEHSPKIFDGRNLSLWALGNISSRMMLITKASKGVYLKLENKWIKYIDLQAEVWSR